MDYFKIIRELGRGGMGEVYLARDTRLGRKVAIKVVNPADIGSPDGVKQFLLEARTTARFNHPHIVTIYAVGEHRGSPYLALEYLEGQNLLERNREGLIGWRETARIGLGIAEALAEAHRHGVLHRDLKPANVLIASDGRLRVLDFGLATCVTQEQLVASTGPGDASDQEQRDDAELASRVGAARGTPGYMAPEVWSGGECTPAVDIWALGMTLLYLLEGKHPWAGCSPLQMAARCLHPSVPMPAPSGDVNPDLASFVERCLSKEPEGRPDAATAVEVLATIAARRPAQRAGERSPFRGLLPWDERWSDQFYGRDAEIDAFLERLRGEPIIGVAGPSGVGKSSFVLAGIVPRLREQGQWLVLRMRPGREPLRAIATLLLWREGLWQSTDTDIEPLTISPRQLRSGMSVQEVAGAEEALASELSETPARLALKLGELAETTAARVLLVVDQAEELFTLVREQDVRERFLDALLSCADDRLGPVRAIFTIREDFIGRLATGSRRGQALPEVTVLGVPSPEALQEILQRPVDQAGYCYDDPDLVEHMVRAVQWQPAALPLLQFVGQMLWQRRDREQRQLRRSAYDEMGGVGGALAKHADRVTDSLTPESARTARDLFLRLVTTDGTRKVISGSKLLEGMGPGAGEVLDRFVQERIIVLHRARRIDDGNGGDGGDETDVELVHESLIAVWDRLGRWIDESREEMVLLSDLDQAAELWERRGRRPEELWHGDALYDALRTLRRSGASVPERSRCFLEAGQKREQGAQRRRRRLATAAVAVLVVVAVVLAWLTFEARHQRRQAEVRQAEAEREGARAAAARGELLEARAKLRGSLEIRDSATARALWWQLKQSPLHWQEHLGSEIEHVELSPSGRELAVVTRDAVFLLDTTTRSARVLRGQPDHLKWCGFTDGGEHLMATSWSGAAVVWHLDRGTVRVLRDVKPGFSGNCGASRSGIMACSNSDSSITVWDAGAEAELARLEGHEDYVAALALSGDGRLLVSTSRDQTLRLWKLPGGEAILMIPFHAEEFDPVLVLSPDTRFVAAENDEGLIRVWATNTGAEVHTFGNDLPPGGWFRDFEFSHDGTLVAMAGGGRHIHLWSTVSRQQVAVLRGHTGRVDRLGFQPEGPLLASISGEEAVRLWSVPDGALRGVLPPMHRGTISALSFSSCGRYLALGGNDYSVRVWDLNAVTEERTDTRPTGRLWGLDFSPDGQRVATGSWDGTVMVWDVSTGRTSEVLEGHKGLVAVAYSPDGRYLASGGVDGVIRLWQANPESERDASARVLFRTDQRVFNLCFAAGGKLLLSCGADGSTRLLDITSGEQESLRPVAEDGVKACSFSSSGRWLASGTPDGTLVEWETASRQVGRRSPNLQDYCWGLVYGPDDRWIAAGLYGGSLVLWERSSNRIRTVAKLKGRAYWLDAHPDGSRVGVPLSNGTSAIVDIETGSTVVLRGHRSEVNRLRFSPDGRLVATVSEDETVRLWHADTGRPFWRCVVLLGSPPEVLTHRGWELLDRRQSLTAMASRPPYWRRNLEREARIAALSPDGRLLCVQNHAGKLELWDVPADRRTVVLPMDLQKVLALDDACVVQTVGGEARLIGRSGQVQVLASGTEAVALAGQQILVAGERRITAYDDAGTALTRCRCDTGVTALTRSEHWIVAGYQEGSIELLPPGEEQAPQLLDLEDTPSAAVTVLRAGPMQTLIAGFANGQLGIWSLASGARLYAERLHGPVLHLLLAREQLYVTTELGDYRVVPLAAFHQDYCALMLEIWEQVPVVWERGQPELRPPPQHHRCVRESLFLREP